VVLFGHARRVAERPARRQACDALSHSRKRHRAGGRSPRGASGGDRAASRSHTRTAPARVCRVAARSTPSSGGCPSARCRASSSGPEDARGRTGCDRQGSNARPSDAVGFDTSNRARPCRIIASFPQVLHRLWKSCGKAVENPMFHVEHPPIDPLRY
jgi:hypothetical protein